MALERSTTGQTIESVEIKYLSAAQLATYQGKHGEIVECYDLLGRPQYRWEGAAFAAASAPLGRTISGSATASLTDAGALMTYNAAGAGTITIPNDATVAWGGNAVLSVYQAGAGAPSFAAGSGVTLRSPSGVAAATQYGVIAAMRVGANEWALL